MPPSLGHTADAASPLPLSSGFSIRISSHVTLNNVKIDNSAGDAGCKGRNTDGFDVGSSTNVHIAGAWVHTQDDCLAINSGSNIAFTGGICAGPAYGLSTGSVGGRTHNDVSNVFISDSKVSGGDKGIRIETVQGGQRHRERSDPLQHRARGHPTARHRGCARLASRSPFSSLQVASSQTRADVSRLFRFGRPQEVQSLERSAYHRPDRADRARCRLGQEMRLENACSNGRSRALRTNASYKQRMAHGRRPGAL